MILSHFDNKKDGTPIIFIHGTASAKIIWHDQYVLLKETNYRVIGIDLRGHGNSKHEGGVCTIDHHLDDIHETLHSIGIKDPIVMVGHSFGAVLSVKFAEKYPEKVDRLMLASMPIKVPRIMCLYYKWFLGKPAKLLKRKFKLISRLPVLKRYKIALQSDIRIIRQIWKESLYWDFLIHKPKVQCPIYFSVGRFDNVALSDWVKKLHLELPNSNYHEFKWAAHSIMDDQPNEFNKWLMNALGINNLQSDMAT